MRGQERVSLIHALISGGVTTKVCALGKHFPNLNILVGTERKNIGQLDKGRYYFMVGYFLLE